MNISNELSKFSAIKTFGLEEILKITPSLQLHKGFLVRTINGKLFLVIQEDRIQESKRFMLQENIKNLEINMSLGYESLEIEFLKDFKFIESLNIVHQPLSETAVLNTLHNLKSLTLDSYFYSELDFDNFPNLENCSIHWTRNAKNLFSQKQLKILRIWSYKEKNTSEYSKLINLEKLSIIDSKVESISEISSLYKLKSLELKSLKKLTSLQGVSELIKLEELKISKCTNIDSIEEVKDLKNLRKLWLIDCKDIKSLMPINNLQNLEEFLFYGSTNIVDGNLNPLTQLGNLTKFSFQNRKHYSHKIDFLTNKLIQYS